MPAKARAYTMKELKGIVEYLTERNAYSEVRARKMWMDFASTGLTTRTWQSLKETFLKRILPDIHNPYYGLSKDQIRSFRTGQDVTNKNVNKLEIHTTSNDESASKDNNTAGGQPSTSNNIMKQEGNTSGEGNQLSKVASRRESVETVILSTAECYSDAELLRVLESPVASPKSERGAVPKKTMTLRDCITYMDPLTPLLQEIVDDFQSEPEDDIVQPTVKTQNERTEKTAATPDFIDLTTDTQPEQEGPEFHAEKEVQNNDFTEDGREDSVSETPESSSKKLLKLKADKAFVGNKKSKESSTETVENEIENTGPHQINETNSAETNKAKKPIQTNSSENHEGEKSVLKEINKDIVNNTEAVAIETKSIDVQDGKPSESGEIINNKTVINSSEVQEAQSIVTEERNKKNINEMTSKSKNRSSESENTQSHERTNKENMVESPGTNGSHKLVTKHALSDKINEHHTDKSTMETKINTVHNGSDLQIKETASVHISEESTSSKMSKKESGTDFPETATKTQNRNKVVEYSELDFQNSDKTVESSPPEAPNSNKTVENSDSLIPNNQEALLKNNDSNKQSSEEQTPKVPEKVEAATTTSKEIDSKTDSDVVMIQNTEQPLNDGLKMSRRKLSSATAATIELSKDKTSIGEGNELSEGEQPSTSKKSKRNEETGNTCPEPPKEINVQECTSNIVGNSKPSEISNAPVGAQQQDIIETQDSQQSTNPCLQSVSLFAEQFMPLRSDSDDNSLISPVVHKNQELSSEKSNKEEPRRIPKQIKSLNSGNEQDGSLARRVKNKQLPQRNMNQSDVVDSSNSSNKSLVTDVDTNIVINTKHTLLLKSHSDSESTEDIQPLRKRAHRDISRRQKKDVLNHMFGTCSGGANKKRQRQDCHVSRSVHRRNCVRISSESSEWVSDSEEEFVSPPRSRHRSSKRYLRPQSSRILQMRQEGALFVAVGKKVYPLVRDDGRAVSYVNYVSGSESEDNDSYWKLKYVKERKRNDDLSKLLENANDKCVDKRTKPVTFPESPILPCKSSKKIRHLSSDADVVINEGLNGTEIVNSKDLPKEVTVKDKEDSKQETVKIKFAKHNEEVCLEGHWQNLHSILSDVMQVFKKDSDTKVDLPGPSKTRANKKEQTLSPIDVSSGKTTPLNDVIDEEARKKINELEGKIFKEIEDIDKSERISPSPVQGVTVRKRVRQTKLSGETPRTPSTRKTKRAKASDTESTTSASKKTLTTSKAGTDSDAASPMKSRTKPTTAEESVSPIKPDTIAGSIERQIRSRAGSRSEDGEIIVNESRLQLIESGPGPSKRKIRPPVKLSYDGDAKPQPSRHISVEAVIPDDSQVLYKFPSPAPDTENTTTASRATRTKKYIPRTPHIYSDCTQNSLESSQGYQDSDFSPLSENFRRKKKYSLPTSKARGRNKFSRNSRKHIFNKIECDASSESSNSNFRLPLRNVTVTNSSLTTEAYRSESYQLLVPKPRYNFRLDRISESPCPNEVDAKSGGNCLKLSPASQNLGSELGSTSNVSFPMSPELSIVEHISVDKNELQRLPDHPTINETIGNVDMKSLIRDSYVISNLDISVPLMQQPCHFHIYQDPETSNLSVPPTPQVSAQISELSGSGATVTDSLLDRMDTARLGEKTTDDLDDRLTNLLLESAKKIATQNRKPTVAMEKASGEKRKQIRRSSTPRKKRELKKSATPSIPVIEECMEYCHSGRKSCPPVICENYAALVDKAQITEAKKLKTKPTRAPKEIIKVKIVRPKNKKEASKQKKRKQSRSTLAVLTDSGITDTSVSLLLQNTNDSVDLIHNHSETCLNANECLDDTEKSQESVGSSLNSQEDAMMKRRTIRDNMTPEFFCCDAQSASSFEKSSQTSTIGSQNGAGFLSGHYSSLITEDLSDEPQRTNEKFKNWYLLSEDESANSLQSFPKPGTCSMSSSYGSNLKKLFPVICSVPDLSDITEFSKETDVNSLKSTRNTDIDSNLKSEFLFDCVANTND